MNYQKGNISVVIAFIIVIGIIGSMVYLLLRTNSDSGFGSVAQDKPTLAIGDVKTSGEQIPATVKKDDQTTKKMDTQIAKNGDTLVMNYTGRLTDGTVFDSNVDPKFGHVTPFEFKLGAGMVIKGWDEGLLGMKVGEKKTLTIPPEKGYGARGAGNAIPPNATLIFDVELVAIK